MVWGIKGSLVVYTLVEQDSQRPPIDFSTVAATVVDFGSKVGESAGLAGQFSASFDLGRDVLYRSGQLAKFFFVLWMFRVNIQSLRDGRGPLHLAGRCLASHLGVLCPCHVCISMRIPAPQSRSALPLL